MKPTEYLANNIVKRMEDDDFVLRFDCGDEDLNDFILNNAQAYKVSKLAVTYVMVNRDAPDKVMAFCSLANDRVSISDFDNKTEFNRFRKHQGFPQSKRMKSYPAVKLCRLGVDLSARGMSVGTKMLDFIKTYFTIDNKTGCRFITVDAYIDAIPFYEKNGFVPLNRDDEDSTYTRLLYYDLNDIS